MGNRLIVPLERPPDTGSTVETIERLGGLIRSDRRAAQKAAAQRDQPEGADLKWQAKTRRAKIGKKELAIFDAAVPPIQIARADAQQLLRKACRLKPRSSGRASPPHDGGSTRVVRSRLWARSGVGVSRPLGRARIALSSHAWAHVLRVT